MSGTTYTGSKTFVPIGTVVSIGPLASATGSPTFTAIAEITEAEFSGAKSAIVKTTNMSSTFQEKLGTIPDAGTVKLSMNRVTSDPGQLALAAAFAAPGVYKFQVQEPVDPELGQTTTGNLNAFNAVVSDGPAFSLSPEKVPVLTFTLEISGPIAFTAGS